MPVSTQLIRNNQPLPLRWGYFHIGALNIAATAERYDMPLAELLDLEDDEFDALTRSVPYMPDSYTFTRDHVLVDDADQEVFIILPGDTFTCYR